MKVRLFFDTNIILDLLAHRDPYFESVAKLVTLADQGEIIIVASALSYSTLNYLLSKYENAEIAQDKLRKFRIISEVSDLDDTIIDKGLNSNFRDFEDALQYFCAVKSGCDILITRNSKDFKESKIPVMTTEEFLASIGRK